MPCQCEVSALPRHCWHGWAATTRRHQTGEDQCLPGQAPKLSCWKVVTGHLLYTSLHPSTIVYHSLPSHRMSSHSQGTFPSCGYRGHTGGPLTHSAGCFARAFAHFQDSWTLIHFDSASLVTVWLWIQETPAKARWSNPQLAPAPQQARWIKVIL